VQHDPWEATAIAETLGDVPVTAPKSYYGNAEAASTALDVIVSLLALERGTVPVTLNHFATDKRCPIQVVHCEPARFAQPLAMILSQDYRGQAATLLVAAAE
jgi:3-oxoacyl-[acyl-carrier-protein] synthase II